MGAAAAGATLALPSGWQPALSQRDTPVTVRFGLTAVVLSNSSLFLDRFRGFLERRLARPVELVQRRTYQEITSLLLSGDLDAAWICGFPFVQHRDRLRLIAVPVYQGAPLYRSYLIARAESASRSLGSLRGHTHAFSDPDSNSGFLVTRHLLRQIGETEDEFFARTFFTYSHRNTIRAVAAGLAQSGSTESYVWDLLAATEPDLIAACRVVQVSELFGFPPIACLADGGDETTLAALQGTLLDMAESADGRALLAQLHLDGFTAVVDGAFDRIAEIARAVDGAA